MNRGITPNLSAPVTVLASIVCLLSSCGGSSSGPDVPPPPTPEPRTGFLTVSVTDPMARPVANANVSVFGGLPVVFGLTGVNGLATVDSVPARARVVVSHEFGSVEATIDVAQVGSTFQALTLQPWRPRPTVALLPVSIRPGSINAARSELTVQVDVVASVTSPFVAVISPDYARAPYLGFVVGDENTHMRRDCHLIADLFHPETACVAWGDSPYSVTAERFRYDEPTIPLPVSPGSTQSATLLLDQSRRVSTLDPGHFRTFAARRFIERLVTGSSPTNLAITGLARDDGNLETPFLLPQQPVWSPLAPGSLFSTDLAALQSAIALLEPLVGGAAPVYDAMETAVAQSAAQASSGARTVVALLGGRDDTVSDAERARALASLRQQRDTTGVRSILIAAAAASAPDADHEAIAELAAALRAPTIAFGIASGDDRSFAPSWASSLFAALDLAADLIEGARLPTLSATLRIRANQTGAFPAGATLRGLVYVQSNTCPFECEEVPIQFAVAIP